MRVVFDFKDNFYKWVKALGSLLIEIAFCVKCQLIGSFVVAISRQKVFDAPITICLFFRNCAPQIIFIEFIKFDRYLCRGLPHRNVQDVG